MNDVSDIIECIWSEPIKREIDKDENKLKNKSLGMRECYHCDGKYVLCERYVPSKHKGEKVNLRPNWLGLDEDYTK